MPEREPLITEQLASKTFRRFLTDPPRYSPDARAIQDLHQHLGTDSSETSAPAESVAATLLIAYLDLAAKAAFATTEMGIITAERYLTELYMVKPDETSQQTFERLGDAAINLHAYLTTTR